MTMLLKQSTAVLISFGPFVDPADGVTLVTSLATALDNGSTGARISKIGSTFGAHSATATVYDAYGNYLVSLDTVDTNTPGRLRLQFAAAASCLPVWQDFMVVPAMIYDSLIGGTDRLDTNVTHVADTAQTARDIGASVLVGDKTGFSLANGSLVTATLGTFVLAKTTNITGFNDLSAAAVNAEADTALADAGVTTTVMGRIDVAISTRLASASYTAPDNASITAIKAKTDLIPGSPAAVSDIPTATAIAAAVFATVLYGGRTFLEWIKLATGPLFGKSNGPAPGTAGTQNFRDEADTKNVVAAAVDADSQRTSVTLNP